MPNTIRLHRVRAPRRVYRAFLNPEAMAKWLPPNGTPAVHEMDARVGGSTDVLHEFHQRRPFFGGTYTELVLNERIRYTDKFEDPNLPGEMQATITLKEVAAARN